MTLVIALMLSHLLLAGSSFGVEFAFDVALFIVWLAHLTWHAEDK